VGRSNKSSSIPKDLLGLYRRFVNFFLLALAILCSSHSIFILSFSSLIPRQVLNHSLFTIKFSTVFFTFSSSLSSRSIDIYYEVCMLHCWVIRNVNDRYMLLWSIPHAQCLMVNLCMALEDFFFFPEYSLSIKGDEF